MKGDYSSIIDRANRGQTKAIRDKKPYNVLFLNKHEEPKPHFHCVTHQGVRMFSVKGDGLRCQICGGNRIATRTVYTYEEKKV